MSSVREIDIKNPTYQFLSDMNNIKNINPNKIKIIIVNANRYIEERNGNKYLTIFPTDKNKNTLKKYGEMWRKMKTRFNSDDDLPH